MSVTQTAVEKVKVLFAANSPFTTSLNPPVFWLADQDLFLQLCEELKIDSQSTVIYQEFGYSKVQLMFCDILIRSSIHNSKLSLCPKL